jgi:hypothetical protein
LRVLDRGVGCARAQAASQSLELLAIQLLRLVPEAVALGAQDAPGETLAFPFQFEHGRHRGIDGLCATALRDHYEELGLNRFQARFALPLHDGIELDTFGKLGSLHRKRSLDTDAAARRA